jgi:hypothetical protein
MRLLMPIYSQPAAEPPSPPKNPAATDILIAEDPFVSSFLRTVLQRQGHKVVIAEARNAGELLRRRSIAPNVVITNRPEVFLEFAGSVHLLYLAAAPDARLASQFLNCRVLRKPFLNGDLLEAVEELTHLVIP